MKLELKHLAPYLPYELKVEVLDYKKDYVGKQYDTVIGVHQWDTLGKFWSVLTLGGAKPNINRVKPILRPLSDLRNKWFDLNINETDLDLEDIEGFGFRLYMNNYDDVLFLIEKHFDINNLIGQGLAIDINTLNTTT